MSLNSIIFRKMCARNDAERDKGLSVPDDVAVCRNHKYSNGNKWQVLDIYRPRNNKGKLPVIVNFHGGGWVYGSKNVYQYYCMELARHGFAVVNPSYRLAPEYRFPAAFEDINSVFAFVLKNAAKYRLDTDRIFGIGDSSGATGMAVYACILTNPAFAEIFPVKAPDGLRLRGLGLNCGTYSMKGQKKAMKDVLPRDAQDEVLKMLHIPMHITHSFPPCFLMTSNGDFNNDQPRKLIPALEKNGIRYEFRDYGDEQHTLGHVFHCNIKDPYAQTANCDETEFFRSLL